VILVPEEGNAEAALHRLREIMGKLKLTVNEDKTQICKVPEGEFDFWDSRSDECTLEQRARPAWLCDRQRKSIKRIGRKRSMR